VNERRPAVRDRFESQIEYGVGKQARTGHVGIGV
jgi:hypothetical protein